MTSESSKASDTERVVVGVVRRPHGVRGEVVVEPLTEVAQRFDVGVELLVQGQAQGGLRIVGSRPQDGQVLLRFAGFEGRDAVEPLRGVLLEALVDRTLEAPEGRFWIHDLIGCRCVDETYGLLGVVEEVVEDGGGELLLVRGEGREIPIPFVLDLVPEVDTVAREIRTRLPEGLLELCGSAS